VPFTQILLVGGFQSILVASFEESSGRVTATQLIKELHSSYVTDLTIAGDSILTICDKDKHLCEIKLPVCEASKKKGNAGPRLSKRF
jgi:hypothetical protein